MLTRGRKNVTAEGEIREIKCCCWKSKTLNPSTFFCCRSVLEEGFSITLTACFISAPRSLFTWIINAAFVCSYNLIFFFSFTCHNCFWFTSLDDAQIFGKHWSVTHIFALLSDASVCLVKLDYFSPPPPHEDCQSLRLCFKLNQVDTR